MIHEKCILMQVRAVAVEILHVLPDHGVCWIAQESIKSRGNDSETSTLPTLPTHQTRAPADCIYARQPMSELTIGPALGKCRTCPADPWQLCLG